MSPVRERVARPVLILLGLFLIDRYTSAATPASSRKRGEAPGNAVAAGELLVEPSTLIDRPIKGDDNRNAAVEIETDGSLHNVHVLRNLFINHVTPSVGRALITGCSR